MGATAATFVSNVLVCLAGFQLGDVDTRGRRQLVDDRFSAVAVHGIRGTDFNVAANPSISFACGGPG